LQSQFGTKDSRTTRTSRDFVYFETGEPMRMSFLLLLVFILLGVLLHSRLDDSQPATRCLPVVSPMITSNVPL